MVAASASERLTILATSGSRTATGRGGRLALPVPIARGAQYMYRQSYMYTWPEE